MSDVSAGYSDLGIERHDQVALLEIRRPPLNYFNADLIGRLLDTLRALDDDVSCRAVVLAAEGKAFCAGADFGGADAAADPAMARALYERAIGLFETRKPIVAAVHGAAIGGGLGLALAADFRVTCDAARLSANFARLGLHAGFGITATLPRLVGVNAAATMLLTGRRLSGTAAHAIGLADLLVPEAEVRAKALELATEIASGAPLAVQDMRQTLRGRLADDVRAALERELFCQSVHMSSADFREGIKAATERREPVFTGQ